MQEKGADVTTEAAAVQIGQQAPPTFARCCCGLAVQSLVENGLDGAVLRARRCKHSLARGVQSLIAELLAHTDDALHATQVHEHCVVNTARASV
ncbi:hypothetical protein B0G75_12021 [Paraburkholderia sp. BL18I3N2]|nr:hypothetical protein B0G75_12021 [Paraburkholderia sp. BL18I3N2]PRX90722.1 hypothetical protein B0G73_14219 [Paraburkholderia sp. BL25I1N1]